MTTEDFVDIYRNYIGNIHKRLFGKTFNKVKLTFRPKFEDSNKTVENLLQCVLKRIDYHNNCREHTVDYEIPNHEHELLRSIYMYKKVKELQTLLNMYIEKYKVRLDEIDKELNDFDNLTIESSAILFTEYSQKK